MNIEPLESRIAPAVVINPLNPKLATYTDVDGDLVTIKVSAGDLHTAIIGTFTAGGGDQLAILGLTNAGFEHANVTVSVTKRGPAGDGLVNVGFISTVGHDLGAVTVQGDLGGIEAGNPASLSDPGVASLKVASMGRFGAATSAGSASYVASEIQGALGSLTVKGDVQNAYIHVIGGADGTIGAIHIGGSLIGTNIGAAGDRPGAIEADGDIGAVTIQGDVQGHATASGFVQSDRGAIKSVTIGGSLIGSDGGFSGEIRSGAALGPVKIGRDVIGGAGSESGIIASDTGFGVDHGNIASVTIGGSLTGGSGARSGLIRSSADLGPVKIAGDLVGDAGTDSGEIFSKADIASVTLGGPLVGGSGLDAGSIEALGAIGPVKIAGDLRGGIGHGSGEISSGVDVANVRIGGSLVGGSGLDAGSIEALGAIGPVKIAGDLRGGIGIGSGVISSGVDIASVAIGGSLIGGGGLQGGGITASGAIGMVKITGDLRGGANIGSGFISDGKDTKGIRVGGSLIGGTDDGAGMISVGGDLGSLVIGGDIRGPSITGLDSLTDAGIVAVGIINGSASGRLGSAFIGGSIITGADTSSGTLTRCASIQVESDIGSLTVKGSLAGNTVGDDAPVFITAAGQHPGQPANNAAFGKISIGGRVEHAQILGGFGAATDHGVNGNAQIGSVSVGGDWIASSISAGIDPGVAGFGVAGESVINIPPGAATDAIISRIASITIHGAVAGTPAGVSASDHYGFVAQQIGRFKAGGFAPKLTAGTDAPIELSPITADITVREI